jgi:hypothetical protein
MAANMGATGMGSTTTNTANRVVKKDDRSCMVTSGR